MYSFCINLNVLKKFPLLHGPYCQLNLFRMLSNIHFVMNGNKELRSEYLFTEAGYVHVNESTHCIPNSARPAVGTMILIPSYT